MKKVLAVLFAWGAGLVMAGCSHMAVPSDVAAIQLVDGTCADVRRDVAGTFAKINAGVPPYVDKDNPALYVFVYDTNVNIVAHPDKAMAGQNVKGKPDAAGKIFRDEIVAGALRDGTGWMEYVYKKPGAEGIYQKSTYYVLAEGSDGKKYVVCCGIYK